MVLEKVTTDSFLNTVAVLYTCYIELSMKQMHSWRQLYVNNEMLSRLDEIRGRLPFLAQSEWK